MEYKLLSERVYYRNPFPNVSMIAELSGTIDCDRLIMAIKRTVNCFDILKATIEMEPDGICYFHVKETSNAVIECMVEEEMIRDHAACINQYRMHQYHLNEGKTIYFVISRIPTGIQLAMNVHHIVADGQSLVYLLQEIWNTYKNNEKELQQHSIDILKSDPLCLSKEGKKRLIIYQKYIETLWKAKKKVFNNFEYDVMFHRCSKRKVKIKEITIEGDELKNLRNQAKEMSISMTTLFLAKVFQRWKDIKLIEVPMNMREDKETVGNYVSMLYFLRKECVFDDFHETVRKLQCMLNQKKEYESTYKDQLTFISKMDANLYDSIFFAQYMDYQNRCTDEVTKLLNQKQKNGQVLISNLGQVLIEVPEGISLDHLYFYPPATEFRNQTVGIVTFNNKMTITIQNFGAV